MSNLEQNTDVANEPREEITDADLAVGLAEHGFHVYLDDTDRQLTFETIYDYFDDYGRLKDGHTFTVPMMEVAQFGALETLCEKFESFNDEVRADGGLRGLSLEDYADELLDDEESHFEWRNGQSEWENVRRSILSGETKFLHNFLYDAAFDYPSRAADLLEDLNDYETTYLKKTVGKQEPLITVSSQKGTNNPFDVTSVGFDTEKKYTVSEFNQALKTANEKWQENWDGISYPSNIVIVTVENLHSDPCSYRINLTDADYNSIQDIVEMLPTPMHASHSTEKAIEILNKAETNTHEQEIDTAKQDKTYAYDIGFTVVKLDIGTEERKKAVSEALKNVINNFFGEKNDMSQPYKNLLEQIKSDTEFIHASEGHLNSLKYALRNAESNKELCLSMLDSVKNAERNPEKTVVIKGYACLQKDAWEEHGVKFTIGLSVDDTSFYYARATDGKVTRDYEYDHEPSREKVISDHTDKLAEEDIDRGEAIYGADGYLAFSGHQATVVNEDNTELMPISGVTPKLLEEFAQKTNSFYQSVEQILDGTAECRIRYCVNESDNTIMFGTLDSEKFDDIIKKATPGFISGELRAAANNNLGKSLYIELGKVYHISDKAENIPQQRDISHKTTNDDLFEYNGYHFVPVGKLDRNVSLQEIATATVSKNSLGMSVYNERRLPYSYSEFYIAAKGSKADIFRCIENGKSYLPGENELFEYTGKIISLTKEKQAEHIPQQRDISHNTTNAVPTAIRGESRGNIMEQSTKFEVSTMSKLEGNGPAKAIGTLVVNGEFAVHGIKVVDGKNGLYVAMPSEKRNGGYEDVVFPVTKEARAAIDSAVLGTYEKLAASPETTLKNNIVTPEKPVSMVYAQMHNVDSDKTQTKAAGQITIDKCFVVTGVKLNEGTNNEGLTKTFVAMPAKPNATGGYDDVAHPITADLHNKVDKAVIASANNIGRYEYKGVKYAELGENPVNSKPLHPKFADKLMAQLDKAGIAYQAKCAETVVISVKAADKQMFEAAQKELTAKLNGKDKPKQKQEQTAGMQNHSH